MECFGIICSAFEAALVLSERSTESAPMNSCPCSPLFVFESASERIELGIGSPGLRSELIHSGELDSRHIGSNETDLGSLLCWVGCAAPGPFYRIDSGTQHTGLKRTLFQIREVNLRSGRRRLWQFHSGSFVLLNVGWPKPVSCSAVVSATTTHAQ